MLPLPLLLILAYSVSATHPISSSLASPPYLPSEAFHPTANKVALVPPRLPPSTSPARRQGKRGLWKRASAAELNGTAYEGLGWDQVGGSYSVPLQIGTPPKTFYLQLDTASSDLLLASTLCTSPSCIDLSRSKPIEAYEAYAAGTTPYVELYDPGESESWGEVKGNRTVWESRFGDGTAAGGFVGRERVSWGLPADGKGTGQGRKEEFGVSDLPFGLINSTNLTLSSQHVSGILGLGFSRNSHISNVLGGEAPTFMEALAVNSTLAYPVFGLRLERNSSFGGSLTIGSVDSSIVRDQSDLEWSDVIAFPPFKNATSNSTSPYLQWALPITNVTMNSTAVPLNRTIYAETRNETWALIDAGTTGIYGPIEDVANLFALIDGSRMIYDGQWIMPCDTRQTMSFSFGGRAYVLQPSDYLIGRVSTNRKECLAWPVAQPPTGDGLSWTLGSTFLRSLYSVFYLGVASYNSPSTPKVGLFPLHTTTTVESLSKTSTFLASTPEIRINLPNILLPLPTYALPPFLFNATIATTPPFSPGSSIDPIRGLANSSYTPLDLPQGGTVTVLAAGATPLPTAGPPDSSQVGLMSVALSSSRAEATAAWASQHSGSPKRIGGGGVTVILLGGLAVLLFA